MKYRKKPVVIEAKLFNGNNMEEIRKWSNGHVEYTINDCAWQAGAGKPIATLSINTLEGTMEAKAGNYIIKGVDGEFYPCKPDIFQKTYEKVE